MHLSVLLSVALHRVNAWRNLDYNKHQHNPQIMISFQIEYMNKEYQQIVASFQLLPGVMYICKIFCNTSLLHYCTEHYFYVQDIM